MKKKLPKKDITTEFAKNLENKKQSIYVLRLYITGATPQSIKAVANMKKICEEYLHGHYELQIIDIYQQPQLAEGDQIIATPTLIKKLPFPLKKLIGDMSDIQRVLIGLDIKSKK